MGVWNKNAGYGREYVDSINNSANRRLSFGRTLYVVKTTDPYYDRMVNLFPYDQDGEPRLFTTITAALAELEHYDTVLIGPGYWNETAKLTITSKKGVKLIGTGTGMQWGEGHTCIGDETHTTDLLDITGCHGLEISNIMFYNITGEKDAINFTPGASYSVEIHDCCFIGDVGGGTVMEIGINSNGSNGPDLYVHDCRFFRCEAHAIIAGDQRNVIKNNIFIVPNSGIGIELSGAATAGYNVVVDNYFLGAGTSDKGIYTGAASTAGNYMLANNLFANFAANGDISGAADADENCLRNYQDDTTTGGKDKIIDPEN